MGFYRHRKALRAWFAIAALLGNVLAGLFCPVQSHRSADYPADLLGPMVICTENGAQSHSSGDDGQKDAGKPCHVCVLATGVALLLALAALGSLIPLLTAARAAFDFIPTFAGGLRRAGLGSRAPPLPA